jgi:metal-sulfur cluster biosynthetic enzyme
MRTPSASSAPGETGEPEADGHFDLDQVTERLRTIFDPEIPINVVDLGLVYSCEARALGAGSHRVEIKMSMTAPGCGMGDVLREEVRQKVAVLPGVAEVDVEPVWDPPWHLGPDVRGGPARAGHDVVTRELG